LKILLTGSRGYIGRPLAIKLIKNHEVIGVDNCAREKWVERVGGKIQVLEGIKDRNFKEVIGDLREKDFVDEIFKLHKPDVVMHLASQPSMPYSDLCWERAEYTQQNNLLMNLNLLWAIRNNNPSARYIITTTTGIPGQNYKVIPEEPVINMAGSWYHISRGFDSANCGLAARQWGLQIIEFRTAIVYGLVTDECSHARFDTDPFFGTVLNRFVQQAIEGKSLTVYGEGDQRKPFISLNDACLSLFNAVELPFSSGHTILNQMTECPSINELANMVTDKVVHIPNPRKEKEDFEMTFENKGFLEVLGQPPQLMKDEIPKMVKLAKWLN
jgi:nucleoside-diphosphate-sugar epimerase